MPAKTNSLTKAPYTKNGSLLHYVQGAHNVWYPNEPFTASLKITGMKSGYSAKDLMLESADPLDDRTFPMFVVDLVDVVCTLRDIRNGVLHGRWMVRKRGANYGLALASEEA
jgi:hypothetical protein